MDPIETKTKVAGVVAFVGTLAATAALEGLDLSGLPAWLGPIAGAAITSALTLLAAYRTRHAADALSMSAIIAAGKRANESRRGH